MFACRHVPLALDPGVEQVLERAYAEPHRAYHTAAHVVEVLHWFDRVQDEVGWREPAEVFLAILFHDAIYDPRAKDNEARSAQLARNLAGASDRTVELILLTARHGALDPQRVDHDAAHFLDCDTAILGASAALFDEYDAAIAIEYQHVPPAVFRAGRRGFLAAMLARPRIFLSDYFHRQLDAHARDNLVRTIARYAD